MGTAQKGLGFCSALLFHGVGRCADPAKTASGRTAPTMKSFNILILEDDVVTSVSLAKALQAELPDAHLLRATTLFESRLLLSSFEIQFFLIDIQLPDGCGIDFILDVTSKHPNAGVVIMTAEPLPRHRDRAQSFGALHFFEKPVSPRTLGQIIRTYRASYYGASPGSDTSFTASLTRLNVMDVLQLKCLARSTMRLDFTLKDGRAGSIYFQDGAIVHAETATHGRRSPISGISALAEILRWRGGKIDEVRGAEIPKPTIEGNWQSMLLQAAQLADEEDSEFLVKLAASAEPIPARRLEHPASPAESAPPPSGAGPVEGPGR